MPWRRWIAAAADRWSGGSSKWTPAGRGFRTATPRECRAIGHPVEPPWRDPEVLRGVCSAEESVGAALTGLQAIQEELETLTEAQRFLAMLAATGASEAESPDQPLIRVAEQARLLAARAEQANAAIGDVLRSRGRALGLLQRG